MDSKHVVGMPALPTTLIPASGSGLHAACGRWAATRTAPHPHHDAQQASHRLSPNTTSLSPPPPPGGGSGGGSPTSPPLLASLRPRTAASSAAPRLQVGVGQTLKGKSYVGKGETALRCRLRPSSAATLLPTGDPEAYAGNKSILRVRAGVAAYERVRSDYGAAVGDARQRRWDAERRNADDAARAAAAASRARAARAERRRRAEEEEKAAAEAAHQRVAEEEAQLRWAEERVASRLRRRLLLRRWAGARELRTKELSEQAEREEGEERLERAAEELFGREMTLRRCLTKACTHELVARGGEERERCLQRHRVVEQQRRFLAEAQQVVFRFINAETKEREHLLVGEGVMWAKIEKVRLDWEDEQRQRKRAADKLLRERCEQQAREFAKERADAEVREATARQRLRIVEADERGDHMNLDGHGRREATERARERAEREAALREVLHGEEQRPVLEAEERERDGVAGRFRRGFDVVHGEYTRGKLRIMQPIRLGCPELVRFVSGAKDVCFLMDAAFEMKSAFNPYLGNRIVSLCLEIGVEEGYLPGDSIGVASTSRRCLGGGARLVRFGRAMSSIFDVARVTGWSDGEGRFGVVEAAVAEAQAAGKEDGEMAGEEEMGVEVDGGEMSGAAVAVGVGELVGAKAAEEGGGSSGGDGDGGEEESGGSWPKTQPQTPRSPSLASPSPQAQPPSPPPASASAADSGGERDHRWLRAEMVHIKGRDPVKELEWLLHKVTFEMAGDEWTPQTDVQDRVLTVAVSLGISPCFLDVREGVRQYRCRVERRVVVRPMPPFFHVPVDRRHVRYDFNAPTRLKDGKRTGVRLMESLLVLHPERDAGSAVLTVRMSPDTAEGDRIYLRGRGVDLRWQHAKRPKVVVTHQGTDVAEVVRGTLFQNDDPCFDVQLKVSAGVALWRVCEVLQALHFSTQAKLPPRPRRCLEVTYVDPCFPRHPLCCRVWVNMLYPAEAGPNHLALQKLASLCVVHRTSYQSPEACRHIEPAVTSIAPEGLAENQHSMGVRGCGERRLFRGGSLTFRIEQGVQVGDTLTMRSCGELAAEAGEHTVVRRRTRERVARWSGEVGGAHSTGTYEGATSPAWLQVDFVAAELSEEDVSALARCVGFTNRAAKPTVGTRWINATWTSHDPAMPDAPPAKARVGVRVCLPIITAQTRFLTQKYIENEGAKKFGQFEIPDPVFKDDDMVAVFDGGSIKVEIVEGLTADDQLGLMEDPKSFEVQELRRQLCLVRVPGSVKHSATFVPHEPGRASFSINLGRLSDRRKALDTSLKKPHANKIRKKELLSLLRNLYYRNSSEDPDCLRKVIRVSVRDAFLALSQIVVEMPIQCINNKTEASLRSHELAYRKGSRDEEFGVHLFPGATLFDPDSPEIVDGIISVEMVTGASPRDHLDVMRPERQDALYVAEDVAPAFRIFVTLGPQVDGHVKGQQLQEVFLGGLSVGTFERRTINTGQLARFNIFLAVRWPGWSGLPCRGGSGSATTPPPRRRSRPPSSQRTRAPQAQQAAAAAAGGTSPDAESAGDSPPPSPLPSAAGTPPAAATPTVSPRLSSGGARNSLPQKAAGGGGATATRRGGELERPFGPTDCDGHALSFEPSPPIIIKAIPKIRTANVAWRKPAAAATAAAAGGDGAGGGGTAPSAAETRASAAEERRRASRLPGAAAAPGSSVFGLPMDACQLLLRVLVWGNNNDPSAMRPGTRALAMKVNAGDDVGDTKVKVSILAQPQLLALAPSYTSLTYVEGSEGVSLSTRYKVGIDQRFAFKRGWLRAEILNGREEDELLFADKTGAHYVVWDKEAEGAAGNVFVDARDRAPPSASMIAAGPPDPAASASAASRGGALLLGRLRCTRHCVALHVCEGCSVPAREWVMLARCLCYRNQSTDPTTDYRRQVVVSMGASEEDGPYDPVKPPGRSTPGYHSCEIGIALSVEAVDNPTEVHIPHRNLQYCSPSSASEARPLQVLPGVQVEDPDTPVFHAPADITVAIAGGGKFDLLELSYKALGGGPDYDDGLQISNGIVRYHHAEVAAVRREGASAGASLRLELRECPIQALEPLLRRVVYRHVCLTKRTVKKVVNVIVRSFLPDAKTQLKPTVTRVHMTVSVCPAPIDYTPGVTQRCVQIGRQPVFVVPGSSKVTLSTALEVHLELIKQPSGLKSMPQASTLIPREFWDPFEYLSWEKNVRNPTDQDQLKFTGLPTEFNVKERDGGRRYDVSMKEGRVCVITMGRKEMLGVDGCIRDACHHATLHFVNMKQPVREANLVRILRSVAYLQVNDKRLPGLQNSLPAQEVCNDQPGLDDG